MRHGLLRTGNTCTATGAHGDAVSTPSPTPCQSVGCKPDSGAVGCCDARGYDQPVARPFPTWDRTPEALPSRNEVAGFAERTRKNLDFILAAQRDGEDVHAITQVVLSLLGIVVFPFERLAKAWSRDWSLDELDAQGWPTWTYGASSKTPLTLRDLIANIRHATAHNNIAFSSESRDLREVTVTFKNRPPHGKWEWSGSIRADHLLAFCRRYLDLMLNVVG